MSKERQETISDIVAEMRGPYYKMGRSNASLDKDMMGYMSFIANRVEAAHKREMADEKRISDAVVQSLRDRKLEMAGEIAAKDAEIEKLHAALKPVLELEDNNGGLWPFAARAVNAVKEAQRIYKEVIK